MNEHDDDVEPEVEEGVEIEAEDFPIESDDDETEAAEQGTAEVESDIDPDKAEI